MVPRVFLIGYRMAAGPVVPGPVVPRRWIAGFRGIMKLKDPLIYYFNMLRKRFGMRQART